jgi:ergothioneine biosynthesis protein EgtB
MEEIISSVVNYSNLFSEIRERTLELVRSLQKEDMVVQPVVDVSPPKWHLGHTTWFFEEFVLSRIPGYKRFNEHMAFIFNSYYETVGRRVMRTDRGNLSRPGVDEVFSYRNHVDEAMSTFLAQHELSPELENTLLIGLNHEQQHQELLLTDIKFILGHNPLFPNYGNQVIEDPSCSGNPGWLKIESGVYEIGFEGKGFHWDNEAARHKTYIQDFVISDRLVSNGEYLQFMQDGGYADFNHWHMEGFAWVKESSIRSPMYWHRIDGNWHHYTLNGLRPLDLDGPLKHVSYYEAYAFNEWNGTRLPTEAEWEVASDRFKWGKRWEWTQSAYLPYPNFKKPDGALGEYNGKFMVNQMVLRGGSVATPTGHSRKTYRNFFHPHLQWQYTGIRCVKQ